MTKDEMKPVAWLKDMGHGDYVDMVDPVGGFYGKCISLYTEDQLREAKVQVLRDAAAWLGRHTYAPYAHPALYLNRMADELLEGKV